MKVLKILLTSLIVVVLIIAAIAVFYLNSKQPQRSGELKLPGLGHEVEVHFDKWAIPHIYAQNEKDAYHTLGYIHAQERLFHMEVLRRLAKGQLAEILGPKLVSTDTLFRTLRLKQFGQEYVQHQDLTSTAWVVAKAYIDGINHFIKTGPTPIEFEILRIPKTPYTLADTVSLSGYMSYSFAAGFKTDPILTIVRDKLGENYLKDMGYRLVERPPLKLLTGTQQSLQEIAGLVADIEAKYSPLGFFEGSNAWVVSGSKTKSGKPVFAGDPHIAFSCPSVWYEAHIVTPGFELYGHYLSGNPFALLGMNRKIAWTLTMFQNDDVDMFREKANPENPDQVWSDGKWVDLQIETETIKVKGQDDIQLKVRRSKHGPILNDAVKGLKDEKEPVALWWAFHDFDNDMGTGYYGLAHANDAFEAREAVRVLKAPGLNFVLADAKGNIAWWATGAVPIRPAHVDPNFILDGSSGKDEYLGIYDFDKNPQMINPSSGIIVSANHQPQDFGTGVVPGYYNLDNRAKRIEHLLGEKESGWTAEDMKAIQLDTRSNYCLRVRDGEVRVLETTAAVNKDSLSSRAFEFFKAWNGDHLLESIGPTIFHTLHYNLAEMIYKDELGEDLFKAFLRTRLPDRSIEKIVDLKHSPWWDNVKTEKKETRKDILGAAWLKTLSHLQNLAGSDPAAWHWEKVHTVEYVHAIGRQKPFDKIFNIGPFKAEGSRDVPNYLGFRLTSAPHMITIGPSTRRIVDFAEPENSLGINPTGQSGYFFNENYADQAKMYIAGRYRRHLIDREEILDAKVSTLILNP